MFIYLMGFITGVVMCLLAAYKASRSTLIENYDKGYEYGWNAGYAEAKHEAEEDNRIMQRAFGKKRTKKYSSK